MNRIRTIIWGGILCCALISACGTAQAPAVKEIPVEELNALTQQDTALLLIDVRSPAEYETVHAVPVKRLIVHTEILDSVPSLPQDKNTSIYFICRSGRRSEMAAESLSKLGYRNVYNVEGGTNAWVSAGLPTESGRGVLGPAQP